MENKPTLADHETWRQLYSRQTPLRVQQIIPEFQLGLDALGISEDCIPDLSQVNLKLKAKTGWQGVYVEGLEEGTSFYPMLAERRFPIGNFIRDRKDLNYTPAPDVFHDLYGHIPFFYDQEYADFCYRFAKRACTFLTDPQRLKEFERLFWFTIEFGLIKTQAGVRVFGAGIASSFGECAYALSNKPKVEPFNIEVIRQQNFDITVMQETLFLLNSTEQLYSCLDTY